jgi:predicted transcriptional regulator
MKSRTGTLTVRLESEDGAKVRRALAAEQRVNLLGLLAKHAMNINEIAAALGVSQPTASVHIRVLEEAGLVESEYTSTGRGSEKRCWAIYDKLVFEVDSPLTSTEDSTEETAMPIGLYTSISAVPTCGLASDSRMIGFMDNPQSFLLPDRADAQILWFAQGWVEYIFPCDLPPTAEPTALEFIAEVCSEAPNYDNDWPSDITVWINGVEIGTWTAPGDFGGHRGRLNPDWWRDGMTQFGAIKSWSVNGKGSYIDGTMAGQTRLAELGIARQNPIVIRIGNRPDAAHAGGVNLFGRHFGNYPQDLILRLSYRLRTPRQLNAAVENLMGAGQPLEEVSRQQT